MVFKRILSIFNFIFQAIIAITPTFQYFLRVVGSTAGGQNPFFQISSLPTFQLGEVSSFFIAYLSSTIN